MKTHLPLAVMVLSLLFAGCTADQKSGRGFTLPDGDAESGQALFVELKCIDCHQVSGVDLAAPSAETELSVKLGGKVARIKSYGELVTSIINPSHRLARDYSGQELTTPDGQSKMRNYNDVMTVAQLIDLVAFLQSHYELMEYSSTQYPVW